MQFFKMSWDILICFSLLLFACAVKDVLGYSRGDFIPERLCATLFSQSNFEGDSFQLKDFDQSTNMKRDYRPSLNGWMSTGSVQVEAGCKLAVCDDAYFTGNCHLLTSNSKDINSIISAGVRSANCSCWRECKCADVYIGKDEYARAYLKRDCSSCDAEYLSLFYQQHHIYDSRMESVTRVEIRSDCNARIVSGESSSEQVTVISGSLSQGFGGKDVSYEFFCDDAKFTPRPPIRDKASSFSTVLLPESSKELYGLLTDNASLANHPGIQAAFSSAENGRSARNVYVVIIGERNPSDYGFPQCRSAEKDKMGVCTIPVNMDHLGLSNTQISIIILPIGQNSADVDGRLMASLDEYLSTHKDLNEAIPNAVIVQQDSTDPEFANEGSAFQRRLHALHSMRHVLVDEHYSNVVFLLSDIDELSDSEKRNPETIIAEYSNEITQKWAFPSPIVVVVQSSERRGGGGEYVNGFRRMENNEYWPKNLETNFENLCEKTGDSLGHAIFKAYFLVKDMQRSSVNPVPFVALHSNHSSRAIHYRPMQTSALYPDVEDEKLDCGDVIPEKTCATLFSATNFEGHSFDLMDFDQSINLRKEYRASPGGWHNTGSVKIEVGCILTVCNKTSLLGTCQLITADEALLNQNTSWVQSASCTCTTQNCRCEDIFIGKHEFGRAYLKGGCNTCHAEYIPLVEAGKFPRPEKDLVEAFVLKRGCNMSIIYSEDLLQGTSTLITGPVSQNLRKGVRSYNFSCDSTQFIPRQSTQTQQTSDQLMIELPAKTEELLEVSTLNDGILSNHLGLQASIKSWENGRSSKIAFVVLIGTHRPKYSGYPQCPDASELLIGECRITMSLSKIGIMETELRVITLPIAVHHASNKEDDYKLMASLDNYMTSNENLRNAIPNAVIVYHRTPFIYSPTSDQSFDRKLQALHALRELILDESYSNVVFLLDTVGWFPHSKQKFQDDRLAKFEKIITEEWAFPPPTVIVTRADAKLDSHYVNGYRQLGNEKYWPLNLQVNLGNIGGDPLGQAIFKEVYRNCEVPSENLNFANVTLVSSEDNKVSHYRDMASIVQSDQPISRKHAQTVFQQLRQQVWQEKKWKRKHTEKANRIFSELYTKYLNLNTELETRTTNLESENKKLDLENKKLIADLVSENAKLKDELDQEKRIRQEESEKINAVLVNLAEKTKEEIWEKLKEDLKKLFQ